MRLSRQRPALYCIKCGRSPENTEKSQRTGGVASRTDIPWMKGRSEWRRNTGKHPFRKGPFAHLHAERALCTWPSTYPSRVPANAKISIHWTCSSSSLSTVKTHLLINDSNRNPPRINNPHNSRRIPLNNCPKLSRARSTFAILGFSMVPL